MSELVFMMGEFEARFPTDRRYARNHMWAIQRGPETDASEDQDDTQLRFGFTAYAVRLLQDVYFLEWEVDDQAVIPERKTIGAIESKKAESDLFAPLAGRIDAFNAELLNDPSAINVDKYGDGWLFDLTAAETSALLSPEQYIQHLHDVWEVTQRTIKGQLNQ